MRERKRKKERKKERDEREGEKRKKERKGEKRKLFNRKTSTHNIKQEGLNNYVLRMRRKYVGQ